MRKTSKPKRVASRPKFAWERQYRDALAETNQLLLGKKIYDAQQALSSRLREIQPKQKADKNSAERKAIEEALDALQKLQIKVFRRLRLAHLKPAFLPRPNSLRGCRTLRF